MGDEVKFTQEMCLGAISKSSKYSVIENMVLLPEQLILLEIFQLLILLLIIPKRTLGLGSVLKIMLIELD